MKAFYSLENPIQRYAWGSRNGISDFTGILNTDNQPMAEMWMGAHSRAPSALLTDSGMPSVNLDAFIASNPDAILGMKTVRAFGERLPFLFKVLSADSPLSLQVHPSRIQAQNGFERENRGGIPLTAQNRNYKDNNHKPEIIMAITPFVALCGFRTIEETVRFFSIFTISALVPLISLLREKKDYAAFYATLLELPSDTKEIIIQEILRGTEKTTDRYDEEYTLVFELIHTLAAQYPDDIGVLSPLFMNVIQLRPSEALYLPEGILHAYIKGTGLELMANSDNVLRGGLTQKYIDIPELLSVLNSAPFSPKIIIPDPETNRFRFRTGATDFELSRVSLKEESITLSTETPAILIASNGKLTISEPNGTPSALRGKTLFIPASGRILTITGTGTCYCASLPNEDPV